MDTVTTPRTRKPGRPRGRVAAKSDAVAQVREALGLTQEGLARELNCSTSSVRNFERRQVLPATGALLSRFTRLANRAGVSLEAATETAGSAA